MSKLEKAIRDASERHGSARRELGRFKGVESSANTEGEINGRQLPVRYLIRAERQHLPGNRLLEKNRIIRDDYPAEALTQYKMLRTKVLQEYSANNWDTLAITSPLDGAGKTLTAINLAITLALHGHLNVFLVDLDLRNPSIADYLDLPDDVRGVPNYIENGLDLQGMLWNIGIDNLVILPNRSRVDNSAECITSKRMRELINVFTQGAPNPIVIFDMPPVLAADDVIAFSPMVDGVLVVASERETSRENLSNTMDVLRGANANVVGVVLNKANQ